MRSAKLVVLLVVSASAALGQTETIVFEGARAIVGDGTVVDDSVLVVTDGVIRSLGPRGSASPPEGATRRSLEGKTLMPLLIDIHGHIGYLKDGIFSGENYGRDHILEQLRILEYFGVGAFQSLGTDLGPDAWDVRDDQHAGRLDGARLFVAGRGFVAPGGGPTISPLEHVPYEVDRPEIARLLVRGLAERGADMVKVWVDDRNGTKPKLPPEIYRAVIDEAHRRGLRVMAHVYYLEDAKDLLRAGVDGFAHMVRDQEVDDEFVRLAKERDVFQAGALAIQAMPVGSGWLQDPALREATPREVVERFENGQTGLPGGSSLERAERFRALIARSMAKLKAAGIRIALGGDTGIPTRFVGYNEHLELRSLVSVGLTPLEAITAGTSVGARILGLDELGTLEPGKSADFLVLDANPLEDIANTTRIAAVYRKGRAIDRDALRRSWMESSAGMANADARAETALVPTYEVEPKWPKPLPNRWLVGAVAGVAVDSRDHVWVVHRPQTLQPNETRSIWSAAPPVLEIDAAGNLVSSWGGPGEGYEWPDLEHGIYVDEDDHVWIGGGGPKDAQILKFTRDGTFLMQIGRKGAGQGSNDTENLGAAAQMTVDRDANELYVADGYVNHRVIVFDSETGAYKRHWGAYGNRPDDRYFEDAGEHLPSPFSGAVQHENAPSKYDPEGPPAPQFRIVHAVRLANDGLVYVCDRTNDRVQVFRKDGTFVNEAFVARKTLGSGSVWDIAFSSDPEQKYLIIPDGTNQQIWILRRDTLEVLGAFGGAGHWAGQFYGAHNIAADSKGDLYITETYEGKRIQKFRYRGMGPGAPLWIR